MAERIMITPQELNDGANTVRTGRQEMAEIVNKLNNLIEDISTRWEGAAKQSFIEKFTSDLLPILKDNMPEILDGVAAQLDAAANTMRDTDQQLAGAFRGQ